jgi:hypothetical protein
VGTAAVVLALGITYWLISKKKLIAVNLWLSK